MSVNDLDVSEWWNLKKEHIPQHLHNNWYAIWETEDPKVKAKVVGNAQAHKAIEQVRKELLFIYLNYLWIFFLGKMDAEDQRGRSSSAF